MRTITWLLAGVGGAAALRSSSWSQVPPRRGLKRHAKLSMASDLFLGVDCGTQGTKVAVYDAETKAVLGLEVNH